MSTNRINTLLSLAAITATMILGGATSAQAAAPVKEIFSSHITNGFEYPEGVAVNNALASPEHGDIYVADQTNHRVQVFSAAGTFVEMFGEGVNATTKENICTAVSHDTCTDGVDGVGGGELSAPGSIAIDPSSGDVYVAENVYTSGNFTEEAFSGERVQEFTAEGEFVLEIGKEVNATTKGNLCTHEEELKGGVKCEGPAQEIAGSNERDAFDFTAQRDLLTFGGPEDLLYVGEERRVQELKADGEWAGEFAVSGKVQALAIDDSTDTIYAVYPGNPVIDEFDAATGTELSSSIAVDANDVQGIAVDASGQLAVSAYKNKDFGDLYEAADGRLISTIALPSGSESLDALGFAENGDLYATAQPHEVLAYTAVPLGEVAASAAVCAAGPASGSSLTFDCTLGGEVNPEGVADTEALFEWGSTPGLGQQTARQAIGAPEAVHAVVGVPPNEPLYYQLVAHDQNVQAPEDFTSEVLLHTAPSVAPRIVGAPSASGTTHSASDLFSELNPENTNTSYAFQYAPACKASEDPCPPVAQASGMLETQAQQSSLYGAIGTTVEVTGLQPSTTYRYALAAKNANGEAAVNETGGSTLPEGAFTTAPAPAVMASTGAVSAITPTSAMLSGSVDPDGQPATYAFELGVYAGADTVYGVVLSGSVLAETAAVPEAEQLTGLQPGTTYAYRIVVRSGYGEAIGAPATFTTEGLPAVLTAPTATPLLPIPAIAFPKEEPGSGSSVKTPANKKSSRKALARCKRERSKRKRTKCEKQARGKRVS